MSEKHTSVADGKYTFIRAEDDYKIPCLRYDESWIIFEKGSNAISSLLYEFDEAKKQRDDLLEVCKNALISLAIIRVPSKDNLANIATDADILKIMGDSFRAVIAQAEK